MPCSIAARVVAMDCASSVPPHIQPPIAQVPSVTRDTWSDVPGMPACSTSFSRVVGLPAIGFFLLRVRCAAVVFVTLPSQARHGRCSARTSFHLMMIVHARPVDEEIVYFIRVLGNAPGENAALAKRCRPRAADFNPVQVDSWPIKPL